MLNLVQLESFVAVAEELNFHRAAERLHFTQPALSRRIQLLESDLGKPLFSRSRRSVQLTASGALLLAEARLLLASVQRIENLLGEMGDHSASLTIGVSIDLAERMRHVGILFERLYPKITLSYREMSSTDQNLALERQEIEVGFLRSPVTGPHVVSRALYKERLVVVLPRTHALASRKTVKLNQLAQETVFLRPRKSGLGLHDKVLAMYRAAGVSPRIVQTTLSPQFVGLTDVASGHGIYILPERVISGVPDLVTVRLDEPDASREVHIAWMRGQRGRYVLEFINTALTFFNRPIRRKGSSAAVEAATEGRRRNTPHDPDRQPESKS